MAHDIRTASKFDILLRYISHRCYNLDLLVDQYAQFHSTNILTKLFLKKRRAYASLLSKVAMLLAPLRLSFQWLILLIKIILVSFRYLKYSFMFLKHIK
jgi:hypothetical protein